MIHMTFTDGYDGSVGVYCLCGWRDDRTFLARNQARDAGDAHLAIANAPEHR